MQIHLTTKVAQPKDQVFAQFDRSLLERLTPPGISLTPVRFDGSKKGAVVHLKVKIFGIIRQEWYNLITEEGHSETESYFVDEGQTMPFPIKMWRHEHRIQKDGSGAKIVDVVTFKTGFFLLDWLMWPALWAQFAFRKPIYRKVFGKA